MIATDVLEATAAVGIELAIDGNQIRYRPIDRMTPELARLLHDHRRAVIVALAETQRAQKRENVRTGCSQCGQPLLLPETQALGVCLGCQDPTTFHRSLAQLRARRQRQTKRTETRP